jgi:hypothetical protein
MKKAKYLFLLMFLVSFLLVPALSLAALTEAPGGGIDGNASTPSPSSVGSCSGIDSFAKFTGCIQGFILQPLIYLIFAVAIVYFLYGVLTYVRKGGDEDDRRAGKEMMIYGIIAIAVMVSVYGLINLVTGTFKLEEGQPTPPVFGN